MRYSQWIAEQHRDVASAALGLVHDGTPMDDVAVWLNYRLREINGRNVRLRDWINDGSVIVTVKPEHTREDPLHWYEWHRHDEGWSSFTEFWWMEWHYPNWYVYKRYVDDGRDCDGRLTRINTVRIAVDKIFGWHWCPADLEWEDVEASQRDEFAEMAGY